MPLAAARPFFLVQLSLLLAAQSRLRQQDSMSCLSVDWSAALGLVSCRKSCTFIIAWFCTLTLAQHHRSHLPKRGLTCRPRVFSHFIGSVSSDCDPYLKRGKLACIEFTGNIIGYASSVVCARPSAHGLRSMTSFLVGGLLLLIYIFRLVLEIPSISSMCHRFHPRPRVVDDARISQVGDSAVAPF